jgi:lysozyme
MNINNFGLEFIEKMEGYCEKAYRDSAGFPTIGTGHKLTRSELSSGKIWINKKPYNIEDGLPTEVGKLLLKQDLLGVERVINNEIKVLLNQNQYNALCSFIFNVGISAFKNSTLLKKLNDKNYSAVPNEMKRWVYSGGRVISGLINRRKFEAALWERD